jgi:hypothetical protein
MSFEGKIHDYKSQKRNFNDDIHQMNEKPSAKEVIFTQQKD